MPQATVEEVKNGCRWIETPFKERLKLNFPAQEGTQLVRQQMQKASPGGTTCGGKSTHFLDPFTTAFQAEVALGSLWKEDPERAGPMISHL